MTDQCSHRILLVITLHSMCSTLNVRLTGKKKKEDSGGQEQCVHVYS